MCTGRHSFIPVPNTVKVTLKYSTSGEVTENIFHVTRPAAPDAAFLTNIANAFKAWWDNKGRQLVTSAMELTEINVTDLSEQNGLAFDEGVTGLGGTHAGIALPNNVAAVVTWNTGHSGKSYRGRSYFAGFSNDEVIQSALTDTTQANLAQAAQTLVDDVATVSASLSVVSLCSNGAWRTTGVASPILSFTAHKKLRTQRRRLPR